MPICLDIFRRRIIPPTKSCNWKGFIDIKASQWKIGGYTGQGEKGQMEFRIYFNFDKMQIKLVISNFDNMKLNLLIFPI